MPGPRLCSNGTSRSLFIRLLHHFPWSGVASEELLLEAKGNPKSHFHIFSFWIVILPSGSFMIGFSHIYIEENAIPATLSMPGTSKDSRLEDSRHSCSWSEGLILMWGALGQVWETLRIQRKKSRKNRIPRVLNIYKNPGFHWFLKLIIPLCIGLTLKQPGFHRFPMSFRMEFQVCLGWELRSRSWGLILGRAKALGRKDSWSWGAVQRMRMVRDLGDEHPELPAILLRTAYQGFDP